jgi:serine/threonine protein kinase
MAPTRKWSLLRAAGPLTPIMPVPDRDAGETTELNRTPGVDDVSSQGRALAPSSGGAADRAPFPGLLVDGKYRLGALLGAGGMGWVFEATNLATQKTVALKYLRPEVFGEAPGKQLAREALAAAKLDHPNVVRVYDFGGGDEVAYIVMERLRGVTLRAALSEGPLPPAQAIAIVLAAAHGVAEAHRHHVVHRDIKPANIFLAQLSDGSADAPRVLDFGVSKTLPVDSRALLSNSDDARTVGTPAYMPLEQLRGERAHASMDVFALGVVLFEALTGKRPFEARNRHDLTAKLATEEPATLVLHDEGLAKRLRPILALALARDPKARYQDAEQFAQALSRATAGRPGERGRFDPRTWPRGVVLSLFAVLFALPFTCSDSGSMHAASPTGARIARQVASSHAVDTPRPPPAELPSPALRVPVESEAVRVPRATERPRSKLRTVRDRAAARDPLALSPGEF